MLASPDLQKAQQAMLGHAKLLAEMHSVELDYSVASLKNVDRILANVFNFEIKGMKINKELESGAYGVALALGCYIIEVIERNFGPGTLRRTLDDEIEQLPYTYEGIEIMPVGWCLYSLYNGARNNVVTQFHENFSGVLRNHAIGPDS